MKGLLFLIFIQLFSCSQKKETDIYHMIQGDWVSERDIHDYSGRNLIFSFEDTSCAYLYAWGYSTSYRIENDLLLIKETLFKSQEANAKREICTFKITKLVKDTIQIVPVSERAKLTYELNEIKDTIDFIKIKQKNNIIPSKVSFFTSKCYGTCPSFFLEIDSTRQVKFYGNEYTEVLGGAKGIIDVQDYHALMIKIQNLQIDSIKTEYEASWTDDQTCLVVIDYNKMRIQSKVYGNSEEPIELRLIFHKLFEIARKLELEKDSTIKYSSFNHFSVFNNVFPPPPDIVKHLYTMPKVDE
jgi:hypothetical protein